MPTTGMIRSILVLLALIPGISQAESLFCPCQVVDVMDGDTVFVQDNSRTSRKIWLAGIDAPELGQRFGEESRSSLIQLVLGKPVDVEYLRRDRYGRIIGRLIKNGQDINLLQISSGNAWYFAPQNDELTRQHHAIYQSAEQNAKAQKLGLWSFPSPTPPWKHRLNR